MGWQWHQVDHVQIICTSLQNDHNTSTTSSYRPDVVPNAQPTVSKHWKHNETGMQNEVKAYTVALCEIKIRQMWNEFWHSLQAMSSQLVQPNHIKVP